MSILIDAQTTFIVQGITGREAVNLTRECLDYAAGAKIVAGVTPGRRGREVRRVPVFDTVAQAVEHRGGDDGSVVTVPPAFPARRRFEAPENAVKLIVIVTERIHAATWRRWSSSRRYAALHHRTQLPGDHRPRRDQDGRDRGTRQKRRAGVRGPVGVISRSGMTTEMS
jgi:succinyl-CoA synthetase alpha subunit